MSDEGNFVQQARREKLARLEEHGVPPFAYSYHRTHGAAEAAALLVEGQTDGPTVRLAGRIVAWRAHGKTTFAHFADASGRIQLYLKHDVLGAEQYGLLEWFDLGDVIGAAGALFRTRTGEVTVRVDSVEMLAKSLRPLPLGKEELVNG